mmetsp:Transcript_16262/g.37350  ORF Transcript_16262/g.37350 Transcript_16262/m.37350 type:complete len:230 (+) Transcript_16262:147-836(+)
MDNFKTVASRKDTNHRHYHRDLPFLMELSIAHGQRDLFLDLVDEMLDNPAYASNREVMTTVLENVRKIGKEALGMNESIDAFDDKTIRWIVSLFEKMALNCEDGFVSVPKEVYELWSACEHPLGSSAAPGEEERAFLQILARDSAPKCSLDTMSLWAERGRPAGDELLSALHTTLTRGAQMGVHEELSSTLLHIHQWQLESNYEAQQQHQEPKKDIWSRMKHGHLAVQK